MTAGEGRYSQAELMDWAQGARVRSAACAAQALAAADSAAAIGAQVDRIIERAAVRNPERAKHLRAIIVTAASQRAAIADGKRSPAAGRLPGAAGSEPAAATSTQLAASTHVADRAQLAAPVPDLAIVHDQARADGALPGQVIERIFAAALTLQDAAGLTTEAEARWRITAAVGDLDELIRLIRGALFGSAHRPPSRAAGSGPAGQLPIT